MPPGVFVLTTDLPKQSKGFAILFPDDDVDALIQSRQRKGLRVLEILYK